MQAAAAFEPSRQRSSIPATNAISFVQIRAPIIRFLIYKAHIRICAIILMILNVRFLFHVLSILTESAMLAEQRTHVLESGQSARFKKQNLS